MVFKGSCSRFEDLLWPYVANTITESDRRKVEGHLAKCGRCRQRAAETRATVELMTGLKESGAPASVLGWGDLSQRLERGAVPMNTPQRRNLLPVGMALAAACSFALVVSFGHRMGGMGAGFNPGKSVARTDGATGNPVISGPAPGNSQVARNNVAPARPVQAVVTPRDNNDGSDLLSADEPAGDSPVRVVSDFPEHSRTRHHILPADPTERESRNAVSSRRDALGVGPEAPDPNRNLVLTGVNSNPDSQRPTNYVMGSIPAPQTISAQDGQGRSEAL